MFDIQYINLSVNNSDYCFSLPLQFQYEYNQTVTKIYNAVEDEDLTKVVSLLEI